MALTKVLTGGLALDAVDNTILKLDDDYALTGTVSGAGGLVLLQTVTASNDATIEIGSASLLTTTYKTYVIHYTNLQVSTQDSHGHIRFGIGGSIKTDANYNFVRSWRHAGSADFQGTAATGATEITNGWGQSMGTATGDASNGMLYIYDPAATNNFKMIYNKTTGMDYSPNASFQDISCFYKSGQAALTSIQFLLSTGTIEIGTFKLYGLV